jgi:hypothetical protein
VNWSEWPAYFEQGLWWLTLIFGWAFAVIIVAFFLWCIAAGFTILVFEVKHRRDEHRERRPNG